MKRLADAAEKKDGDAAICDGLQESQSHEELQQLRESVEGEKSFQDEGQLLSSLTYQPISSGQHARLRDALLQPATPQMDSHNQQINFDKASVSAENNECRSLKMADDFVVNLPVKLDEAVDQQLAYWQTHTPGQEDGKHKRARHNSLVLFDPETCLRERSQMANTVDRSAPGRAFNQTHATSSSSPLRHSPGRTSTTTPRSVAESQASSSPLSDNQIIIPKLRNSRARVRDRIVIEVGGQAFSACKEILEESLLFKKTIAQRESYKATASDGSAPSLGSRPIRVENDPTLFAEILKYLRTGSYPLYWNRVSGFDIGRYGEMHAQALFYRVPKLERWIARSAYLDVVNVETVHRETRLWKVGGLRDKGGGRSPYAEKHVHRDNKEISIDAVLEGQEEVWTCPAGEEEHDGDSTMCEVAGCCGSLMTTSAKDHPEQRTKVDVVRIFTTEKVVTINWELLRGCEE